MASFDLTTKDLIHLQAILGEAIENPVNSLNRRQAAKKLLAILDNLAPTEMSTSPSSPNPELQSIEICEAMQLVERRYSYSVLGSK